MRAFYWLWIRPCEWFDKLTTNGRGARCRALDSRLRGNDGLGDSVLMPPPTRLRRSP